MPRSLHQRWTEIVAAEPEAIALSDAPSGEQFTFAQLDSASRKVPPEPYPSGTGVDFILGVLAGWRAGLATCPVEVDNPLRPDLCALPDGVAHAKLTSGSTGAPRLVLFTADQLAADARNIVQTMGLQRDRPNIGVISMAHSYGFSNLVLPLLLHGIPLILGGDPLPGSLIRALDSVPRGQKATLPAVPAMWRAWSRAGCLDDAPIATAISAGAPLTIELESTIFETSGLKVHNFYGSSECGGIAFDRSEVPRASAEQVGSPLDGVAIEITDSGCLSVLGEAVSMGYWPEDEGLAGALSEGVFTTQDLAKIGDGGMVELCGRAGDLINIAGRKVDPASIEAELLKHPEVDHCLVFGIASADPERVDEIVAIASGGEPEPLAEFLGGGLPAWQRVRHWWIKPELAPNTRGKIPRAQWRDRWREHHQASP